MTRPESYSSLKTYLDCPRQYQARYITREIGWESSPAALRGEDLHERMRSLIEGGEFSVQGGETAAKEVGERFARVLMVEDLKARGWKVLVEVELGLTADLKSVGYHDGAWLRGRLDLVLVPPRNKPTEPLVVVDWKTGRTPGSVLQLQVAAALHYPAHRKRKMMGLFAYLDQGLMERHDMSVVAGVEAVREAMGRVEAAWEADAWPMNRGGPSCRWCQLKGVC
jgi:CRISPR/Cas system-associated exonuclease Cas4 (RecB family)